MLKSWASSISNTWLHPARLEWINIRSICRAFPSRVRRGASVEQSLMIASGREPGLVDTARRDNPHLLSLRCHTVNGIPPDRGFPTPTLPHQGNHPPYLGGL
jgi:hypothetical protein